MVDLPMKTADFPKLCLLVYQRVAPQTGPELFLSFVDEEALRMGPGCGSNFASDCLPSLCFPFHFKASRLQLVELCWTTLAQSRR